MQVFDHNQQSKVLADMLGAGGEGNVYPLRDRSDVIIKVYHDEKLIKHRTTFQRKIEAMIRAAKATKTPDGLSWPLMSVFNAQQQWIGYAMYRAQGKPMRNIAHAMAYQQHFPNLDRITVVNYLLSFLSKVEKLHQRGIFIGDYNLNNFLCATDKHEVSLIDCDSYQVTVDGQHYPCPVGSPDLTPIEHHGKDFNQVIRNELSERFSIAIVLFQCLMMGRHPYDVVGGDDPVTNLRNGQFAYGIGAQGIPRGPWYNIWSHMPYRLKNLFITVFNEGVQDTSKRPTIAEWKKELNIYLREMQQGWHNTEIKPSKPKDKEYRGVV